MCRLSCVPNATGFAQQGLTNIREVTISPETHLRRCISDLIHRLSTNSDRSIEGEDHIEIDCMYHPTANFLCTFLELVVAEIN
ncbi:MAG: hypothetical protein HN811_01550 [Phycisphaerae bacterium]|nr:hypothetical protein [Phycisphaerae bacterium]